MKSVLSVGAGFVVWSALWCIANAGIAALAPAQFAPDGSTDNVAILPLFLVLPVAYSFASGRLTARLAPTRPMAHAVALGLILTAVGTAVQILYWDVMPLWYHLPFLATLLPAVWLGARTGKQPAALAG